MKAVFARGALLALASGLAGCTTGGSGPTQVTRFHLGDPVARGQIAVETFEGTEASDPELRTYAAAVEQELTRLGWTLVRSVGQSEQVAQLGVDQQDYRSSRPGPVTLGVGGGTGGWYSSGAGAGVGVNLGGGSRNMVATMLRVRIKRRSDGTVFWEGRASSNARADRPEGSPAVIAARLAEAVFRGFPGESGQTISVK
jgi:hypothetical protein